MVGLRQREVAEKATRAGVARPGRGHLVEAARLKLHHADLPAHLGDREGAHEPHGPSPHESPDVRAVDQGNVLAEPRPVLVNEPLAVDGLLVLQLHEHRGCRRITLAQLLRKVAVDAPVLLLQGNCQRQDLAL